MKKLLSLVLALVMCLGCVSMITSCSGDEPTATLDEAKEYLSTMYKNSASPKGDYDLVGKVIIKDTPFVVTWAVDSDKIAIKESTKANFWTVDLPDFNPEEFTYKLTATIKNDAGETTTVEFTRTMGVIDNTGVVTAPTEGVAYKLFVEQVNLAQTLFAKNSNVSDGKYIDSTNDPKAAADYFVEAADGGFKIYTMVDNVKTYVYAHLVEQSKYLTLSATESSVFKYNSEKTAWVVDISGESYYVGTYQAFNTFSISLSSYLDAESIGISSFPGGFMTKEYAETLTPDPEKEIEIPQMTGAVKPVAGTKYNVGMVQGNKDNAAYYLTGAMNGYYMATSTKQADATNVYVEEVSGGYNVYAINKGIKQYINVVVSGSHINNVFEATASTVWVWDDTLKTVKASVEGIDYILGTSATGTYTTFGMVKASEKNFYGQFVPSNNADSSVPSGPVEMTLAEANAAAVGTQVIISGVVVDADTWNTNFNNMSVTISDGKDTFYVFRLGTQVAVGDYITVTGEIGEHNGKKQIAQGSTATITAAKTVSDIGAIADDTFVILKGTISGIKSEWSESYGNMEAYITDGTTTILLYRIKTKLAVGDEVVVMGKVGSHSGNKQIATGATAVITKAAAG